MVAVMLTVAIGFNGSAALSAEPSAAGARLQTLFDAEWEYGLRESPTWASHLGDKRYNDRWRDLSTDAVARRHQHNLDVLRQLDAIPQMELNATERLNYRLFRRQLEWDIEGFAFQGHLMPLDQRGGIQDENSVADGISFDSVKDYEDWLARLRAFPAYVDQTIALMRRGIQARVVQPQIVMRRVPAQIKKQIVDDPKESLFYKPFKSFPADVAADERERLQRAAQTAVKDHVVPAFRQFAEFFEKEYLPGCFAGVGAWQLPRGDEFYAYSARQYTTTDLTPQQIHDIGKSEVARIRGEMERIKDEVKFAGSLLEFFEHLRTDPKFQIREPQQLLTAYQAFCKKVDPQLPKLFKTLPRIPYGVEPIPDNMAPDTTTAYYRPPAADGSRAGTYFVNLYKPESRPTYEIAALSLHEAVPGHHLQIALATELTDVPTFRRFTGFTAYVEGWALYSESLGSELGAYDDPYSKFGQLTYEMWRAIRLVVDTGIHSLKWSRDDAIAFFKQNAAKNELDIVNEVDRYIAWPGQALAYKIGELKIRELRQRAQERLGEKFDLREFHDVVLRSGAVPLDILESQIDEWIGSKR
jgi:prolyl oligopeptidase